MEISRENGKKSPSESNQIKKDIDRTEGRNEQSIYILKDMHLNRWCE